MGDSRDGKCGSEAPMKACTISVEINTEGWRVDVRKDFLGWERPVG